MTQFVVMFIAKAVDNLLNTTKAIFIQRNKAFFAGISLSLSTFIAYYITKIVVQADGLLPIVIASLGSGAGCCAAVGISNKLSKDRLFVNILMCDDFNTMKHLHDYLAIHHITNVVSDSYNKNLFDKIITVTAYCETKEQSRLLDEYIIQTNKKMKRVIQKA